MNNRKKVRAHLVKFLLRNNCLDKYVLCYKAFHNECESISTEGVIDKTIDTFYSFVDKGEFNETRLGQIFNKVRVSFRWDDYNVLTVMSQFGIKEDDAWSYWNKMEKKINKYAENMRF